MSARRARPLLVVVTVLVVTALALVGGCSAGPPPVERSALAEGIEDFLAAADDGRYDQVRTVLVDVAGERRYVRGDPASRGDVHSVTKSVLATLVGIAVDRGQIPGVGATLGELLPDYAAAMPAPLRAAPLQQVLTMTAGIPDDGVRAARPPAPGDDWARYALTLQPQHPPGAGFVYSTTGSHILSAVLTKATGLSPLDYARRELFGPLGISADPGWSADPQGRQLGGTGLALSAEEMLALGRLYLAGGQRDGRQVLSGAWIADATTAHVDTGGALPGYGYQWWVTTADGRPAFAAQGFGGQLIEVVPDLALVVVVRSDAENAVGAPPEAYAGLVDTVIAPVVADD